MKKTLLALCCVAALISCKKTAGPEGPQAQPAPRDLRVTAMLAPELLQVT